MAPKFTPVPAPDGVTPAEKGKLRFYGAHKDNFKTSTFILFGALLHGLASFILPRNYALLPVVILLLHRVLDTLLMSYGLKRNYLMDRVVPGRYTAQIPGKDGAPITEASEQDVAMVFLGTRSNHPLGLYGPGNQQLHKFAREMIQELNATAEEQGFLGSSSWASTGERDSSNQFMTVLYFRSMDHVHSFAHGKTHLKGWKWFESIVKDHPHLGIFHELYHVPKKHWENVYTNYHTTGLGNIFPRMKINGESVKPLFSAEQGVFRTSVGRLGKGTGSENEKYEEGHWE